jgi:hypothetical protein
MDPHFSIEQKTLEGLDDLPLNEKWTILGNREGGRRTPAEFKRSLSVAVEFGNTRRKGILIKAPESDPGSSPSTRPFFKRRERAWQKSAGGHREAIDQLTGTQSRCCSLKRRLFNNTTLPARRTSRGGLLRTGARVDQFILTQVPQRGRPIVRPVVPGNVDSRCCAGRPSNHGEPDQAEGRCPTSFDFTQNRKDLSVRVSKLHGVLGAVTRGGTIGWPRVWQTSSGAALAAEG